MAVLTINVCANRAERTSLFDRAVLADEEVIADARPTLIQMPLMDRLCRDIIIVCHANMVDNNAVGDKAVLERSER